MDRFLPSLLEIWREACRHIRIQESIHRMHEVLTTRLHARATMLRRLDQNRTGLETVAVAGDVAVFEHLPARSACPPGGFDALEAWCRTREIRCGNETAIESSLPGAVPPGISGEIMLGGLNGEHGAAGVVLISPSRGHGISSDEMAFLQALLEPLSAALMNDLRVRELEALREAAEADRRSLLARLGRQDIADTIVGADDGLKDVLERVSLVGRSDAPVLILGETGTGKEVIGRAIHNTSQRKTGPFLRVNCGAIPPELIDSELFGHERGSFTGAISQRKGWFERADGGTLFLDEIGDLPSAAQVRLLRVLQDGTLQRVGGQSSLSVNVRLVAATNRDLHALMNDGRFRSDLWYRIAVFPIHLPALRERIQDIPALSRHFALRAAIRLGLTAQLPTGQDLALLSSYPWPGNIRELGAVIERAAILGDGKCLEIARALGAGKPPVRAAAEVRATPEDEATSTLNEAATVHIERALRRTQGRIEGPAGAARQLAINPHTLRARMRKLGIDWKRFRKD